MRKARTPFAVIASAGACAGLAFCYVLLLAPPWQSQVAISFNGYTNDNSGTRVARFILNNESSVAVCASPFCDRVDRNRKVLEPRPGLTNSPIIPPKKAWMFSVPAPVGQGSWRLLILCNRVGLRSELWDCVNSSPRICAVVPMRWRGIRSDFIESGWVGE
jgi:hypothetical protein